jgi:hypothetical protein
LSPVFGRRTFQFIGVRLAKFETPLPDGLAGQYYSTLCHKLFDIAKTEREAGLFLDDTIPDMSDQWGTAYFKRFKLETRNILKETCSLSDGDGHDVEP